MKQIIVLVAVLASMLSVSAQERVKRVASSEPAYFMNPSGEMFISTNGGASWKPLGKTVMTQEELTEQPFPINVAPNPTSGNCSVAVSLASSAEVEVRLLTLNGRLLTTIAKGIFAAGERSWSFSTSGYAAGAYICTVTIGGRTSRALLHIQ